MKTYTTIQEIKANNKMVGDYFFSPDTMRFFKSEVESNVIHDRYFITSEIDPSDKKAYSIRLCLNGKIETIGKFHGFDFYEDAEQFINSLPIQLPFALNNAIKAFNNGDKIEKSEFITHALIEPENNEDGSYSDDSYCGACSYLIDNYEKLGFSFIQSYKEMREERQKADE